MPGRKRAEKLEFMKRLSLALLYALLITGLSIGIALQSARSDRDGVAVQRLPSEHLASRYQLQETVVPGPRS